MPQFVNKNEREAEETAATKGQITITKMFRNNQGDVKRGIGQMTKEDLKANEKARKEAGL